MRLNFLVQLNGIRLWQRGMLMLISLFCYHSYTVSDLFIWTIHLFEAMGIQG